MKNDNQRDGNSAQSIQFRNSLFRLVWSCELRKVTKTQRSGKYDSVALFLHGKKRKKRARP